MKVKEEANVVKWFQILYFSPLMGGILRTLYPVCLHPHHGAWRMSCAGLLLPAAHRIT